MFDYDTRHNERTDILTATGDYLFALANAGTITFHEAACKYVAFKNKLDEAFDVLCDID